MSTPVPDEKLVKLKKMLKKESHRWFQLGIQMRVPMEVLKKIEKENGRRPPDRCFFDVLEYFLKHQPKRKWKDIFEALEEINKKRLKREVERKYKGGDSVVDDIDIAGLVQLLGEATPDWFMFGQNLEIPPARLKEFRDEKGMDQCLSLMIDYWMEGDYAFFETVIEALESIGNRLLARQVREEFLAEEIPTPEVQELTWLDEIDNGPLNYEEEDAADVLDDIRSVTNWEELGLTLKIKPPKIDEIKRNRRDQISECRIDLVNEWLRNGNATWRNLCIALDKIGHRNLAKKIATKHRLAQDTTPHDAQALHQSTVLPNLAPQQPDALQQPFDGVDYMVVDKPIPKVSPDGPQSIPHQPFTMAKPEMESVGMRIGSTSESSVRYDTTARTNADEHDNNDCNVVI